MCGVMSVLQSGAKADLRNGSSVQQLKMGSKDGRGLQQKPGYMGDGMGLLLGSFRARFVGQSYTFWTVIGSLRSLDTLHAPTYRFSRTRCPNAGSPGLFSCKIMHLSM